MDKIQLRIFNIIIAELHEWLYFLLQSLPGKSGRLLRRIYFKLSLNQSGWVLSIGHNVEVSCPRNISLGNNFSILSGGVLRACNNAKLTIGDSFSANGNVRIIADCGGIIEIGNNVMIGPNVVIRSSNHVYKNLDLPMNKQGHIGGKISIGDDVWVAANVVILPNVKIGSHSIVAAGAVVSKDVPEYSIMAGVPAKVIGIRNRDES